VDVVADAAGLTGRAGLPLVLETLRALGLDQAIAQHVHVRERQSGYSEVEKVEALVLLLAAGGTCLDDIAVLQANGGLGRLVDRKLASADALRHFVYAFHDDALIQQAQAARPAGQVAYIPAETAALQGLRHVNGALVHRVAAQGHCHTATLDHDATLQNSHKREALPHYQGGRGYQPAAIYWAEQDLVVADEYRDGNVPAGMDTLPLIERGFASLPASVTACFFRADSACYNERTLQWLADPHRPGGPAGAIGFTISADMTERLHAVCAAVHEPAWHLFEDRPAERPSTTPRSSSPRATGGRTPRRSATWPSDSGRSRASSSGPGPRRSTWRSSATGGICRSPLSSAGTGRRRARSSWCTMSPRTSSAPPSRPTAASGPTPRGTA
jgi:hypothetical protein